MIINRSVTPKGSEMCITDESVEEAQKKMFNTDSYFAKTTNLNLSKGKFMLTIKPCDVNYKQNTSPNQTTQDIYS